MVIVLFTKHKKGFKRMKITYDKEGYQILFEYPETEVYINANNIVEARKHFIDMMAFAFDSAVNEKFRKTFDEQMEDVKKVAEKTPYANVQCVSDIDHEWECTGTSTIGTTYCCKKCYATKTI